MILDKVEHLPVTCSIEISVTGNAKQRIFSGIGNFYDSTSADVNFEDAYFGKGSLSFSEEMKPSNSGNVFRQKVIFRFPNNDLQRSERMDLLARVRFINIILSDGRKMIIGRNDIRQNARIRPEIETNERQAEITIESVSMFPAGFYYE